MCTIRQHSASIKDVATNARSAVVQASANNVVSEANARIVTVVEFAYTNGGTNSKTMMHGSVDGAARGRKGNEMGKRGQQVKGRDKNGTCRDEKKSFRFCAAVQNNSKNTNSAG